MELRRFRYERYKGYVKPAEVELAPLTIFVGANNSGKSALASGVQLLAGGLNPSDEDVGEPLPFQSGGIQHGRSFEDLVAGRTVHGQLNLSATFRDNSENLEISARVRNVVESGRPPQRQIAEWIFRENQKTIHLNRHDFDVHSPYDIKLDDEQGFHSIEWNGLLPSNPNTLANWLGDRTNALKDWASGIRHLTCPRALISSPFTTSDHSSDNLGSDGKFAPLLLANDDHLRVAVRDWYLRTFGVNLDIVAQGSYSELIAKTPAHNTNVHLRQSGRGLSHVLPVVVMALTTHNMGPGVDIIEHPESELHPNAHSRIADLLIVNLAGPARPMIVETHSEILLLRARRWIAEGRLPPTSVVVYWIRAVPKVGSVAQRINIQPDGQMDSWPEGVFLEDYEEIIAIQRAARLAAGGRFPNED